MSDQDIEQEIQAKGLTAPRVTPDRIEAVISGEYYFTALEGTENGSSLQDATPAHELPLSLLTICVLVLVNGFTVTGESACASPENFDAELGKKIARQNAVSKVWALEGYLLKSKLSYANSPTPPSGIPPHQQRVLDEKVELDSKLNALVMFLDTSFYRSLHIDEQARLAQQAEYMGQYSQVLKDRIAAF